MANTATITYQNATATQWGFDPVSKQAIIIGQQNGPRTQDYDHTALTAAARACPDGSEGREMYASRAESIAALDSTEASKTVTAAPSLSMKPGQP